jgi:hypothetical protein
VPVSKKDTNDLLSETTIKKFSIRRHFSGVVFFKFYGPNGLFEEKIRTQVNYFTDMCIAFSALLTDITSICIINMFFSACKLKSQIKKINYFIAGKKKESPFSILN